MHEKLPNDLDTISPGLITLKPQRSTATLLWMRCLRSSLKTAFLSAPPSLRTLRTFGRAPGPTSVGTCRAWTPYTATVNVPRLFYTRGRGHGLPGGFEFVRSLPQNRATVHAAASRSASYALLHACSRRQAAEDRHLHDALEDLRERVRELIGAPGDAIALVFRIVTCACGTGSTPSPGTSCRCKARCGEVWVRVCILYLPIRDIRDKATPTLCMCVEIEFRACAPVTMDNDISMNN